MTFFKRVSYKLSIAEKHSRLEKGHSETRKNLQIIEVVVVAIIIVWGN